MAQLNETDEIGLSSLHMKTFKLLYTVTYVSKCKYKKLSNEIKLQTICNMYLNTIFVNNFV